MYSGDRFSVPWISEGDREPSWDGFIYAYSNKNQAKKNLMGRAAVQVKGKQVKNVKRKAFNIRYPWLIWKIIETMAERYFLLLE